MEAFDVFSTKFPEFNTESQRIRFPLFLVDANNEISQYDPRWGLLREAALELLIAHKLSITSPRISNEPDSIDPLNSGNVKKIEVSDERWAVEYNSSNNNEQLTNLSSTKYGQEYLRLLENILGQSSQAIANNNSKGTSRVGKRGRNIFNW